MPEMSQTVDGSIFASGGAENIERDPLSARRDAVVNHVAARPPDRRRNYGLTLVYTGLAKLMKKHQHDTTYKPTDDKCIHPATKAN